jgi:ABC-2 type transport system permease protein
MMKKAFSIIKKDTLLRFSSPVEWLFFFILPVIFILVLSGGTGEASDARNEIAVVDLAQSDLSMSMVAELEKSASIKPEFKSLKGAVSDFESQQFPALLIIPEDFTLAALQEGRAEVDLRHQPNNLDALIAQQAVQAAIEKISSLVEIADRSLEKAEEFGAFESQAERQAYFDEAFESASALMAETPQRVTTQEGKTLDSSEYDPRANSTAGQMITWVFVPLIGLSATFAWEREAGTLRRLLITPTRKALYIGATVTGQVLTAVVQMVILILFGAFVLQVDWGDSPLALGLIIVSSTLAAAALGTMLGTFVKTSGQGNGLALMLGMGMALMGGCWYPHELFPEFIRNASKVLPTTWAMQGFLDIAVRGQGLAGVWQESLVLLGFAFVFFLIGVWRFKYE